MKSIQELVKLSSEEINLLKQNYIKKLDNRDFREIVNMLNRLSKEGWSIVSSNIYTVNRISGPQNCISVILERPIKT